MDKAPLLSRDWIKMTMKYPGFCLICKQKINSAEVGYWSRAANSILHENCYNLSELHDNKNQDLLNNKTDQSKNKEDNLLANFITQRQNKEKCFICGSQVDFRETLILALLKLERNIGTLETFFCSECLSSSDLHVFEEYKHAFSKNL